MARRGVLAALLMLVVWSLALDAQVTSDRLLRAGGRAAELAHVFGRLCQSALQSAEADRARQRQESRAQVDPAQPGVRRVAVLAARRERDHVCDRASERCAGGGREDRPRVLAIPVHRVARRARVLRLQQPWRRDPGRHALHGHARRAPRRPRCHDRPAAVERRRLAIPSLATRSRWRRSSSRTRSSSASAAASTASAASSRHSTRGPARKCGASTPFPDRASPATRRGAATRGRRAAARRG